MLSPKKSHSTEAKSWISTSLDWNAQEGLLIGAIVILRMMDQGPTVERCLIWTANVYPDSIIATFLILVYAASQVMETGWNDIQTSDLPVLDVKQRYALGRHLVADINECFAGVLLAFTAKLFITSVTYAFLHVRGLPGFTGMNFDIFLAKTILQILLLTFVSEKLSQKVIFDHS